MQATKDSFYIALRNRLVAVDPNRQVTLDGATRPAIAVIENEPPTGAPLLCDTFYLYWGNARPTALSAGSLMEMDCTISYCTRGTIQNGSLDRGRDLASLDGDLLAICSPPQTPKCDYSSGSPVPLGSTIFWTQPVLNAAKSTPPVCGTRGDGDGVLLSGGEAVMSSNPYAQRSQMAPAARAVRAYAAPVNRIAGVIVPFDPATEGNFDLESPPAPWIDLGWVENFQRTAATKFEALRTGPNSNITVQCRVQPEARVEFDLLTWGKVQLGLSGGTQQMNVLAEQPGLPPQPSGGAALPASPVQSGSTPTQIVLTSDQLANYSVGNIVAVDVDYNGQSGYLGSGASGAYLPAPLEGPNYIDFVRRITFNVSRVCGITSSALQLAAPLIAQPIPGMGVQQVVAFVDREGASFFQEWSGLFIVAPDSGGRSCFYYPRLQPAAGAAETRQAFAAPLFSHQLHVTLRAMPTTDANDNETVLCYRSYFPAATAAV